MQSTTFGEISVEGTLNEKVYIFMIQKKYVEQAVRP